MFNKRTPLPLRSKAYWVIAQIPFRSLKRLFDHSKTDGLVKSHKSDGTVKSSRCKARESLGMRRTYQYAAVTKDEVQRRRWTFYEAVKNDGHQI